MTLVEALRGAVEIFREGARHLYRRPLVDVRVVVRTADGFVLLARREGDGAWSLPGGSLPWGETVRAFAERHVLQAMGQTAEVGTVLGVTSEKEDEEQEHAVRVLVSCRVADAGSQARAGDAALTWADPRRLPAVSSTTRRSLDALARNRAPFVE